MIRRVIGIIIVILAILFLSDIEGFNNTENRIWFVAITFVVVILMLIIEQYRKSKEPKSAPKASEKHQPSGYCAQFYEKEPDYDDDDDAQYEKEKIFYDAPASMAMDYIGDSKDDDRDDDNDDW